MKPDPYIFLHKYDNVNIIDTIAVSVNSDIFHSQTEFCSTFFLFIRDQSHYSIKMLQDLTSSDQIHPVEESWQFSYTRIDEGS